MKKSFLEILINILLGASWALVLVGSTTAFFIFYPFGLFSGILAAFMGSLLGFFFVVLLETVSLQFEKLREMKKQTEILEEMREKFLRDEKIFDY